jgi:hypothetical protein
VDIDGAMFFPYTFDFNLHRSKVNVDRIHIMQLDAMTRMTDDPYFASVAGLFTEDYPL